MATAHQPVQEHEGQDDTGLYCSTAGTHFQSKDELVDHYRSDFHRCGVGGGPLLLLRATAEAGGLEEGAAPCPPPLLLLTPPAPPCPPFLLLLASTLQVQPEAQDCGAAPRDA